MNSAKFSVKEVRDKIPGAQGERFVDTLQDQDMVALLYAPLMVDNQSSHKKSELYVIIAGIGEFVAGNKTYSFEPGDMFFVRAGVEHRFTKFTEDFVTWVVFYGETLS